MLKRLLILGVLIPLFVSCSNENLVVTCEEPVTVDLDMISLSIQIDSINDKYAKLKDACSNRGYVSDYAIQTAADVVGGYVGKKIFSWAGASIGAACGNPAIAACGYLAGRQIGKAACSAVASMGAAWVKVTALLARMMEMV